MNLQMADIADRADVTVAEYLINIWRYLNNFGRRVAD